MKSVRAMRFILCMVISASHVGRTSMSDSITSKINGAFVPSGERGLLDGKKVGEAMSLVRSSKSDVRYSLESNLCWRLIDFPVLLENGNQWPDRILQQKADMFPGLASFDYWRTNCAAFFRLADHIGEVCAVSTNFFQADYKEAYRQDCEEWRKESEECNRRGTVFVMKPGRNMQMVHRKLKSVKFWNRYVPRYRKDVVIAFSRRIQEYMDIISPEERKKFMKEFSARAKLSSEEKKLAFGDYAE